MKQLPARTAPPAADVGTAALLLALGGGPTAMAIAMIANMPLVRAGCTPAAAAARSGLVVLALGGSTLAMWLASRLWQRFGDPAADPSNAAVQRNRFLALFALVSAGGSIGLGIYFAAVVLFLELCWFA